MIASRDVYMKAYGTPKTAMIHAMATFGGIGEACVTAIEGAQHALRRGPDRQCRLTGDYLLERLKAVQAKYPNIVKDVRGKGLMVGLDSTIQPDAADGAEAGGRDARRQAEGLAVRLRRRAFAAGLRHARRLHRIQPQRDPAGAATDLPARSMSTGSSTPSTVAVAGIVSIVKDFVKSQMGVKGGTFPMLTRSPLAGQHGIERLGIGALSFGRQLLCAPFAVPIGVALFSLYVLLTALSAVIPRCQLGHACPTSLSPASAIIPGVAGAARLRLRHGQGIGSRLGASRR